MASEWRAGIFEQAPLEIIDGDRGVNYPKRSEFSASGHCLFLNARNVTPSGFSFSERSFISKERDALLGKGRLVRNDVVLTTRGTVGNVAYFDGSVPFEHMRINSGMVILRARRPTLEPRYLYFFVRSALFGAQVSSLRTGSAQPQLPIRDINKIEIPIPPVPEQRAIAHILGTLDDKIELNQRMNEALEAMARTLFQSWFVDFDPVRAKAEGRDPGLPRETAELFPDGFEESELGEVPRGWSIASLGEILELAYGKALKQEERRIGEVLVFGSNGQVGWHDQKLVDGPGIVVGRKGNPGVVTWAQTDFWAIDTAFYVVPRADCSSLRWLYYALARQDLASLGADSAVPGLNRNLAYMSLELLPPRSIQDAFNSYVQPLFDRREHTDEQGRTLAGLRDALLPKLISGELRVKDAERFVARMV